MRGRSYCSMKCQRRVLSLSALKFTVFLPMCYGPLIENGMRLHESSLLWEIWMSVFRDHLLSTDWLITSCLAQCLNPQSLLSVISGVVWFILMQQVHNVSVHLIAFWTHVCFISGFRDWIPLFYFTPSEFSASNQCLYDTIGLSCTRLTLVHFLLSGPAILIQHCCGSIWWNEEDIEQICCQCRPSASRCLPALKASVVTYVWSMTLFLIMRLCFELHIRCPAKFSLLNVLFSQ